MKQISRLQIVVEQRRTTKRFADTLRKIKSRFPFGMPNRNLFSLELSGERLSVEYES